LSDKTGIPIDKIKDEVTRSINFVILEIQREKINNNSYITTNDKWEKLSSSIMSFVKDFHKNYPLRQGISKDTLRRTIEIQPKLFGICIDLLINKDLLSEQGDVIYLFGRTPEFDNDARKLADEILIKIEKTPFTPPSLTELENECDTEVIKALISMGYLIQTSEDVVFRKQEYDQMLSGLIEHIKTNKEITLSQFRDMFQTSRKYALSFLEYLDKKGITIRDGDKRIIRNIDKV